MKISFLEAEHAADGTWLAIHSVLLFDCCINKKSFPDSFFSAWIAWFVFSFLLLNLNELNLAWCKSHYTSKPMSALGSLESARPVSYKWELFISDISFRGLCFSFGFNNLMFNVNSSAFCRTEVEIIDLRMTKDCFVFFLFFFFWGGVIEKWGLSSPDLSFLQSLDLIHNLYSQRMDFASHILSFIIVKSALHSVSPKKTETILASSWNVHQPSSFGYFSFLRA